MTTTVHTNDAGQPKIWTSIPERRAILIIPSMDTLMKIDATQWDEYMGELFNDVRSMYEDHEIMVSYPKDSTTGQPDLVQIRKYDKGKNEWVELPPYRLQNAFERTTKFWKRGRA